MDPTWLGAVRRTIGAVALRLYTFLISHFSEKVRWTLDFNRVEYEEKRLLPGPHVPTVRRHAPKSTVPLLLHDDTVIQGSKAILDYIETHLGATRLRARPEDATRAAEIEALADQAFGLGTQRIFYFSLLEHRAALIDLWAQGGPVWGPTFYKLAFPVLGRALRATYDVRPEPVAQAKDLFRRTFDELDRTLASRQYLLGDTLSRADVTVASLLAPLCQPPEHPLRWPSDTPPEHATFVAEFRDRPTWAHVRRLYRDHRRAQRSA